jgi:hypothetical protein
VGRIFPERVEFLIKTCKADPNTKSNSDHGEVSPLHVAVLAAGYSVLSNNVLIELIVAGADRFTTDTRGMTALHLACCGTKCPNLEMTMHVLNILLGSNVDKSLLVSMKDVKGKTGLDYMLEKLQFSTHYVDILNTLIEAGTDINDGQLLAAVHSMQDKYDRCRFSAGTKTPTGYMVIKVLLLGGANPYKSTEAGGFSAMTLASCINENIHPAADNIKAIFAAIKQKTDTFSTAAGNDRDIKRWEIERIIQEVETKTDCGSYYTKHCNTWGRRLEGDELKKNDNYLPDIYRY